MAISLILMYFEINSCKYYRFLYHYYRFLFCVLSMSSLYVFYLMVSNKSWGHPMLLYLSMISMLCSIIHTQNQSGRLLSFSMKEVSILEKIFQSNFISAESGLEWNSLVRHHGICIQTMVLHCISSFLSCHLIITFTYETQSNKSCRDCTWIYWLTPDKRIWIGVLYCNKSRVK